MKTQMILEIGRKKIGTAAAIVGLSIAGCTSAQPAPAHHTHQAAAKAAATTPAYTPAPVPSPAGTASGSCDYTLANDPSGTDWLTAEVDLTNTGNVGAAIVRVKVSWPQEGFAPITAVKKVHMPYGATGMPVRFHVSAGSIDSGSNIIDNLQAWEQGHNYPSNDCKYKEVIVGTYGVAH